MSPFNIRDQPVKEKAARPVPKNRLTSFFESKTESGEVLSPSPSSEKESLMEEIKQLRTKNGCLQKKNNMSLEENKLLKLQRFSFQNLCENI